MEDLALCGLGVSEIHHLVHELVDNDKVVANTLFLEFFEIFDEDGDEAVEEDDDLCGIGVAFRQSQDWRGDW